MRTQFDIYVCILPNDHVNLQEREVRDPITRFKPATSMCLSKVRTWISNIVVL